RRTEVFLRIRRVIPFPESDGRPGDAGFEYVRLGQQRHQGRVPAVAPSVNAYARDIGETKRAQPANPFDLVVDLDLAQVAMDRRLKPQSAARGAAVVDLEDHEAVFGQHLRAQVDGLGPAVVDHLRTRATI